MTKNKNLFKNISLFFCLVPMLLLSLFVALPNKKIQCVSANYTYVSSTFNSSNLILTRLADTSSSTTYKFTSLSSAWTVLYLTFSFKIDYDSSTDSLLYYVKGQQTNIAYIYEQGGTSTPNTFANIGNFKFNSSSTFTYKSVRLRNSDQAYYSPILFSFEYFDSNSGSYIVPNSNLALRPSLMINKIVFGNYSEYDRMTFANNTTLFNYINGGYYNFVSLVDTLGFRYTFYIPVAYHSSESIEQCPSNYYTYREYFTSNAFNLGDNSAYQQGYNDGYNTGVGDGNSNGYNDGYSAGETVGYGNGYNAGLEQSNKYSFNSLIGAVIDAPVSAFTSLLNFELLGVNILGLITGLLSLAVIVLIIKLCMGGR